MRTFPRSRALLTLLLIVLPPAGFAQTEKPGQVGDEVAAQRLSLLFDLQALEAQATKLNSRVAVAAAKAEIADAAWKLDEGWAKKLLHEAYELTLPERQGVGGPGSATAGARVIMATPETRARWAVRNRVLTVASRDKSFVGEMVREFGKQLGRQEEHLRYSELADTAIGTGDMDAARDYILQAMDADPSQANVAFSILRLATRDRVAADQLTLRYIERLRAMPTALAPGNASGVTFVLQLLLFAPNTELTGEGQPVPQPGPAVMRAYVSYVVEALSRRAQSDPGSLPAMRLFLLSAWGPLKQYAPELTGAFLELEQLSRRPGEDASLPRVSIMETYRERGDERVRRTLAAGDPDPSVISLLINDGEFEKARKLISKLGGGPQKDQFAERADAKEAIALVARGDTAGAQRLAEQLTKAVWIVQAYSAIVQKCVAAQDRGCASNSTLQAVKQLKRADAATAPLPAGIPVSAVADAREFDPVLSGLDKLAGIVLPADEPLAWEVWDEMIAAANRSELDTAQGRIGFDVNTFSNIASKSEERARQLAERFKDPLRQIVAHASICRWKAAELTKPGAPGS
jgi:hypothetical protein